MILKKILLLSFVSVVRSQLGPGYGYHELIGIPKAEHVRRLESSAVRIVGGSKVPESAAIPYQAGIVITLTTGWPSLCGGALLSRTRVLTAAHCWFDGRSQAQQFTIVLGSLTLFSGGTRITTTDVTMHPSWNTVQITFDIAMVRISSVDYTNDIQAIPLPTMAEVNNDFAGMIAKVSGYGKTSDAQNSFPTTTSLYYVTSKVISNAECQNSFSVPIYGSHICTSGVGNVGTCDGDSGSPLTVVRNMRGILVGIVSFGLGYGCQRSYPSVYSRVTAYLSWIEYEM